MGELKVEAQQHVGHGGHRSRKINHRWRAVRAELYRLP
jgi:hypothetical protein